MNNIRTIAEEHSPQDLEDHFVPLVKRLRWVQGFNSKESYLRGVRIFCTAVYCHWVVM